MEGCHWSFRKASKEDWAELLKLLLEGKQVSAKDTVGWLVDFAGPNEEALQTVWKIVTDKGNNLPKREVNKKALNAVPSDIRLEPAENPGMEAARKAILDTMHDSCNADLNEALTIQAKHSANFMISKFCKQGRIGAEFNKAMNV
jgi:hypothetical protein